MSIFATNEPDVVGLEWLPAYAGVDQLSSTAAGVGIRQWSTAAETIDEIKLWLNKVTVTGTFALEVVPRGSESPTVTTTSFAPNEDVTLTNITGSSVNTAGNRYQNIDEGYGTTTTDYLRRTSGGVNSLSVYEGRFNSSGALTGQRILSVTLRYRISVINVGYYAMDGPFLGNAGTGLVIGGVVYDHTTADSHNIPGYWTALGPISNTTISLTWNKNPATGAPWTIAAIQAFDSTDEFRVFWYNTTATLPDPQANTDFRVHGADLLVTHCTENRVALGEFTPSVTPTPAWVTVPIANLAGSNWSKADATEFVYILRRLSAAGTLQLGNIGQAQPAPWGQSAASLTVTSFGLVASSVDQSYIHPLIPRTTAPADSVDAMPYASILEVDCHSAQTITQEFSNATNASPYGIFNFWASYVGAPSALSVKLKRRSDNVQLGGTATLSVADFEDTTAIELEASSGPAFKRISLRMPSDATLASATQYYLEFTCAATSPDAWRLRYASDEGQGVSANFGGSTDRLGIAGAEDDDYDLIATLSTVPDVLDDFLAELETWPIAVDASEGTVGQITVVKLSWAQPTIVGGAFAAYDLQRSEDSGVTWNTVAQIVDYDQLEWQDQECLRGFTSMYRARVVKADLSYSDWVDDEIAVPRLPVDVHIFVSNERPDLACAFKKLAGTAHTFPTAATAEFYSIIGRDHYVVLEPEEVKGVELGFTVLVSTRRYHDQGAHPLGFQAFDRLRALTEARGLSYICYQDCYGGRLLAHVSCPEAPYDPPGSFWGAVLRVVQVTTTFSIPEA